MTLLIPSDPDFLQVYDDHDFLGTDGQSLRGSGDLRHVNDDTSRLPIYNAHDFACRCFANHGDVVIGTGRFQCLLDAIGHHQYGGKNKHDECDAKDRKDCC